MSFPVLTVRPRRRTVIPNCTPRTTMTAKLNNEIRQQLKLTQGFLHAQGKKGFCFRDNPDHYESLVTVYKEKTESEHLTDNERFNILGSLLDGESEAVYNCYLCSPNKTLALEHVWRSLKLTYGYRD